MNAYLSFGIGVLVGVLVTGWLFQFFLDRFILDYISDPKNLSRYLKLMEQRTKRNIK